MFPNRLKSVLFTILAIVPVLFSQVSVAAGEDLMVTIGYLEQVVPRPPVLSNLEEVPEDQGIAGVQLGIADNNTTGKFLKQNYTLQTRLVGEDEELLAAARALLGQSRLIVANMPAESLLAVADLPEADGAILINASATDGFLRNQECRANLLHAIPSRAMLADALSQFAVRKRWKDWVLIEGAHPGDQAFAAAIERSAAKYTIDIKARKTWEFDADVRRSAASEVPLFVQDFPDHDLLVIADELGDFGRYFLYHGWLPRPVAGSEGLRPDTWSAAVEQHGAAQLQSRFQKHADRPMRSVDYAAWVAARTIGEAVTRTNSSDADVLRSYILSGEFELAAFKGRKLSYRSWNGQLRQPIPLSHPRAVVALAPIEGFLHQHNEMDTLGLDKPESDCKAFGG